MKHKTVRGVLLCARRLIKTKGWTQGSYARLKNGVPCAVDSNAAARFCMLGAMDRCDPSYRQHVRATNKLLKFIGDFSNIASYNDHPLRTKSQVIAVYDAAIKETRVK